MNPTPVIPSERRAELHAELRRFPCALFQFDPRMRAGWLSDRYFLRTVNTLAHAGRNPRVTMQVFAKEKGVVAGLYEAVRLLQTQLAGGFSPADVQVDTLIEGDRIEPWETVMHVRGPYRAFGHLETPLLGVLARRTLVATNVRSAIEAAAGKPLIFMAPRHDDWRVQTPDGYAAQVGGAHSVSSNAGGAWWGSTGVGTMPHAMIAAFGGDVVAATLAFARYVRAEEPDVSVASLVDYHNDAVTDAVRVARAMREEFGDGVLSSVRVDTSERLIDRSLIGDPEVWGREKLTGVSPWLVHRMRDALDAEGFHYVGIVVSGGFTPQRIRAFEQAGVPVAAYGVGSSLLGHNTGTGGLLSGFDFTADLVEVDGRPESKVGRGLRPNPRLVRLDWEEIGE